MSRRVDRALARATLLLTALQLCACAGDTPPRVDFGQGSGTRLDLPEVEGVSQALTGGAYGYAKVASNGSSAGGYSSRASIPDSPNSVFTQRLGLGHYFVAFEGLGGNGGNAQVVSSWVANDASASNRCEIFGFGPSGAHEWAEVKCSTFNGAPADVNFRLQYMRGPGVFLGPSAYAGLAVSLSTGVTHTVPANLSWNSDGKANTIVKESTGIFAVNLPGLGSSAEPMVQVTASGSSGEYCKVRNDERVGVRDYRVRVGCFNAAGFASDAPFLVNAAVRSEIGVNSGGAYARVTGANNTSWHTPATTFNSRTAPCGTNDTVFARLAIPNSNLPSDPEAYELSFGSFDLESSIAHVTAKGFDSSYCVLMQAINGVMLTIRCWDPNGRRARTQFLASLSTYKAPCPKL